MVRVMGLDLSDKQSFKRNIGNVVHLERVADKKGLYFYNETYEAKRCVQQNVLPFNNNVLFTNISNITEETAGPVNCEGYLVWVHEAKTTSKGEIRKPSFSTQPRKMVCSIG